MDIYRGIHQTTEEHTLFSRAHEAFTTIEHTVDRETTLSNPGHAKYVH